MDNIGLFKDLPPTCLSDALESINKLDSAIKPLKDTYRFAGSAVTIKMPVGEYSLCIRRVPSSAW